MHEFYIISRQEKKCDFFFGIFYLNIMWKYNPNLQGKTDMP